MASIEQFAAITRTVIADDGFSDFLPTVLYPNRKSLSALEGAPTGPEIESIALAWAAEGAVGSEDFLVAFKIDEDCFKIIKRHAGEFEEGIFSALNTPNKSSQPTPYRGG